MKLLVKKKKNLICLLSGLIMQRKEIKSSCWTVCWVFPSYFAWLNLVKDFFYCHSKLEQSSTNILCGCLAYICISFYCRTWWMYCLFRSCLSPRLHCLHVVYSQLQFENANITLRGNLQPSTCLVYDLIAKQQLACPWNNLYVIRQFTSRKHVVQNPLSLAVKCFLLCTLSL